MEIQGYCDEKFASVREEFAKNFTERGDIGANSKDSTLERPMQAICKSPGID
jgi:hypothetical protein